MSEESTTPDLEEAARRSIEAFNRRDFEGGLAIYWPDAVWDTTPQGMGVFEGREAIRGFLEDRLGAYEDYEQVIEEFRDLGNGVTFGVLHERGRIPGSSGSVEVGWAAILIWREGLVERGIAYTDINEARVAAERIAGERELAVSPENVEVVRRLLGPFEQGDIVPLFRDDTINASIRAASEPFFTPDFECVFVRKDVGRATYLGLDGLRAGFVDWLEPWESYHAGVEDVIDAGHDRVVVLTRDHARPAGSSAQTEFLGAPVWTVRESKVARIEFYWDRSEGLAAAGLEE
jgi:ketosteroid isomerase-like protein